MKILNILLFVFLTTISFISFAQTELNYGFKFGAGSSKLKFEEFQTINDSILYKFYPSDETGISAHFDIFIRAVRKNYYLQTELLYTFNNNNIIQYSNDLTNKYGGFGTGIGNFYFTQINVPVIIGIFKESFHIQAGPILSYLNYKSNYRNFEVSDNKFSLAYHLGLEIDIKNFIISARYKNNIIPIIDYAVFNGEKFDYNLKTSEFMFSVGFILGKQIIKRK